MHWNIGPRKGRGQKPSGAIVLDRSEGVNGLHHGPAFPPAAAQVRLDRSIQGHGGMLGEKLRFADAGQTICCSPENRLRKGVTLPPGTKYVGE